MFALLSLQHVICGYLLPILVLMSSHLCYDSLFAIAKHQIGYMQMAVVDGSLIKYLLGQLHRIGLELNEHQWLHLSVVYDSITTFFQSCYFNWNFHGY